MCVRNGLDVVSVRDLARVETGARRTAWPLGLFPTRDEESIDSAQQFMPSSKRGASVMLTVGTGKVLFLRAISRRRWQAIARRHRQGQGNLRQRQPMPRMRCSRNAVWGAAPANTIGAVCCSILKPAPHSRPRCWETACIPSRIKRKWFEQAPTTQIAPIGIHATCLPVRMLSGRARYSRGIGRSTWR
ncbi:MAG: hypothetical protein Q9216_000914 [Gyalolechia sp. 2 TL-2023]